MPTIRKYQEKDREDVRYVLVQTGSPKAREKDGPARAMQQATYCDYYLDYEPHNCFVIANDEDRAVGFILCTEDYRVYIKRFMRDYAPRTKGMPLPLRVECIGAARMPRLFVKKYPAHLHIDILQDYQRMGLGHKLMDALIAHLREKGVPGLMLGVGAGNVKGRNFYHKYGYKKLLRIPSSVVMGIEL